MRETSATPKWDGARWFCELPLPSWALFLGERASPLVEARFEADDPSEAVPPTAEQRAAVALLLERQADLSATLQARLREHYDDVRPRYLAFARRLPEYYPQPAVSIPENPDVETFARLHTLEGSLSTPSSHVPWRIGG